MKRRLVLFDVDGTLLDAGGAGKAAIRQALQTVFDATGPIDDLPFDGLTDLRIARTLLGAAGWSDASIDQRLERLWQEYETRLGHELARSGGTVRVCPGVPALLAHLDAHPFLDMALLTGNVEGGAWRKLEACGLRGAFRFGAFGSDCEDRPGLPAIALARAARVLGHDFTPRDTIIVGDTPEDIACARAGQTRVMAVATGNFSAGDLEAHAPDWVVATLADTEGIIETWETA